MGGSSARVSPEIGSYVRLDVHLIFEQGSGSPVLSIRTASTTAWHNGRYLLEGDRHVGLSSSYRYGTPQQQVDVTFDFIMNENALCKFLAQYTSN